MENLDHVRIARMKPDSRLVQTNNLREVVNLDENYIL